MARCIFCDEWAGPHARWHESCLHEFELQMSRRGPIRRFFARATRIAIAASAVLTGLFSTPASPAVPSSLKSPSQGSPTAPRNPRMDADDQQPPGDNTSQHAN